MSLYLCLWEFHCKSKIYTYRQKSFLESLQVNPNIKFEVFIHKVDGLSDDHKIGKRAGYFLHSAVLHNDPWIFKLKSANLCLSNGESVHKYIYMSMWECVFIKEMSGKNFESLYCVVSYTFLFATYWSI